MSETELIFRPMSRALIEADATRLLSRFQPGVLSGRIAFDVEDFVEFELEPLTGVQFDVTNNLPPEIHGLTDPLQNMLWVHADLADDSSSVRFYRSTLAHEVGHCFYHVKPIQEAGRRQVFQQGKKESGTELYRRLGVKPYLDPEWQAWTFAGALLMPKGVVIQLHEEGADVNDLAKHFNVNQAFVRARMKALKL